jgi:hypothetical protein
MYRNRLAVVLIFCALGSVLMPNEAQAQTRPFKIIGAGVAPDGIPLPGGSGPHSSAGYGAYLGTYTGEGEEETLTATFNDDGTITGTFQSPVPFVFTGANGDQLACYYGNPDFGAETVGTFTLVPVPGLDGWFVALFVAEFVPYAPDCTGIFAGVSGGWIMYATTAPFPLGSTDPVDYSWEGSGSLTFSRGN